MTESAAEIFSPVFRAVDGDEFEVTIPDTRTAGPLLNMLGEALGEERVDVVSDPPADEEVRLIRDGEVVASSPLESLMDTFLLVNSDLYRTGTSGVDRNEAPAVLTSLNDVRFRMDGFPKSTKQKLLLILVSRFIENRALTVGSGRLDTAFQRLSRVDDENGTRTVYSRLADSDVDLHLYGVGDATPLADADATLHTGESQRYRRTWFVVYTAPDPADSAALVAVEVAPNSWESVWTYRPALIERSLSIIESTF